MGPLDFTRDTWRDSLAFDRFGGAALLFFHLFFLAMASNTCRLEAIASRLQSVHLLFSHDVQCAGAHHYISRAAAKQWR